MSVLIRILVPQSAPLAGERVRLFANRGLAAVDVARATSGYVSVLALKDALTGQICTSIALWLGAALVTRFADLLQRRRRQ